MTPFTIKQLIKKDMSAVDDLLKTTLNANTPVINDICQYIIQNGGKRLRPALALLSGHAVSLDAKRNAQLATIVEAIHTATLLHDDVVDDSKLRRGKATANIAWDNPRAVLSGDFLYATACVHMADFGNARAMQVLTRAMACIAEGEVQQLNNCHDPDIEEARYFQVIYGKTAKLFEAACQLPAVLAGEDEATEHAMAAYGCHIGTAFQLIDDILDYTADAKQMGKNLGDDLAEGKPTLPLIYAIQHASQHDANVIRSAIQTGDTKSIWQIQQILETTQAITYTQNCAIRETEKANAALGLLPDSRYKDALLSIGPQAIKRKH